MESLESWKQRENGPGWTVQPTDLGFWGDLSVSVQVCLLGRSIYVDCRVGAAEENQWGGFPKLGLYNLTQNNDVVTAGIDASHPANKICQAAV